MVTVIIIVCVLSGPMLAYVREVMAPRARMKSEIARPMKILKQRLKAVETAHDQHRDTARANSMKLSSTGVAVYTGQIEKIQKEVDKLYQVM